MDTYKAHCFFSDGVQITRAFDCERDLSDFGERMSQAEGVVLVHMLFADGSYRTWSKWYEDEAKR